MNKWKLISRVILSIVVILMVGYLTSVMTGAMIPTKVFDGTWVWLLMPLEVMLAFLLVVPFDELKRMKDHLTSEKK